MKRFSQQFKKQADSTRLRAAERAELKARITTYMEYHPLPATVAHTTKAATKRNGATLVSEQFRMIRIQAAWLRGGAAFLAVLVFVVLPAAAEQSLPGDILYPIKTQITEPLRAQLAFSPYAKIQWDTTQVERRVAEARLLASQGKLTPQTEASVAKAVQDHAAAAQQEIATLRKSNADGAAIAEINLASALAVQSQVLDTGSTTASTDGRSIALLAGTVNQAQKAIEASQGSTTPSYATLLSQVQLQTTNAYNLFDSVKTEISATQTAEIERRLSDIQRQTALAISVHGPVATSTATSTATATTTSTATSMATATTTRQVLHATTTATSSAAMSSVSPTELLRRTLSDVLKLISYMTNIDVRAHVSINSLIPVTLTDAERIGAVEKLLDTAQSVMLEAGSFPKTSPAYAKVAEGSSTLARFITKAQGALDSHDLDAASSNAAQAEALANDMAILMHGTDTTAHQATTSTTPATSTTTVPVATTTPPAASSTATTTNPAAQ